MTVEVADTVTVDPVSQEDGLLRIWPTIDRAMVWAGDRINPILVKETRQALKSRQFVLTFGLLLFCAWGWSILGTSNQGPELQYNVDGAAEMFYGYYIILAVPMFLIVPFGAFRSIAGEQEDRTYELMSITTLGPRLIVRGKLGSSILQMIVYLSAISPCLAFTYMLRGLDFPTILFVLGYTVLVSLGLSAIALLLGTVTTEKHWQSILSVLLILGLLIVGFSVLGMTMELVWYIGIPADDVEFWQGMAAALTAFVGYFALVYQATAAQLTFPTDNRSTRLRIVMVVHYLLFTAWMAWLWVGEENYHPEVLMVFLTMVGIHWYVMGVFMSGESRELSVRVKRALPQSFLGRIFLTWFNPGPGTGFMLAISGMLVTLVTVCVAMVVSDVFDLNTRRNLWMDSGQIIVYAILIIGYMTIYLGIGNFLVRLLQKFTVPGVPGAVAINAILLGGGIMVPWVIHMALPSVRNSDYALLHVFSPLSLQYITESPSLPKEWPIITGVVVVGAIFIFCCMLPSVVREVRHLKTLKPTRVVEEDRELAGNTEPEEPKRTSPWG